MKTIRNFKTNTWYGYDYNNSDVLLADAIRKFYILKKDKYGNVSVITLNNRKNVKKSNVRLLKSIGKIYEIPPLEGILIGEVNAKLV